MWRPQGRFRDGRDLTGAGTILVIDDSLTIRRAAQMFLEQAGYHVVLAADGYEALAKIGDHRPLLVVCDIVMPRLGGYQTCALIKHSGRFHDTPVLMLSSSDSQFDRARAAMAGSAAHLAKPFTRDSLLAAVRTLAGSGDRLPPFEQD